MSAHCFNFMVYLEELYFTYRGILSTNIKDLYEAFVSW